MHSIRGLRGMLRGGRSHFFCDWRRLIGRYAEFDRETQSLLFWWAITFDVLMATLTLAMGVGATIIIGLEIASSIRSM